ncbi:unnamed protein product [Adineta steineri]|uniref:Uncharacterized protein n=1 Tax=Adineta steineri TaxID=433720 RepID=A0A815X668_9BILA|nr:unnamed protein product [Adineta steineri]CAF1552189.1 unnamed protein product [Adineta steineri]
MRYTTISSKSGPIFRMSTFRNDEVLVSESIEHLPSIRIIMVIICFLIGIGTLINLIVTYIKYKLIFKQSLFYRIIVPFLLFLNIIFHVSHYAHNIYDPAGYHEPKFLYRKIVFSEMEQTFLFNFPLSILFMIATRKLLLCCTKQPTKSLNMFIVVALYCLLSMISGGHYIHEPPSSFSLIHNITISGETIVAFLLFIVALCIHRSITNKINKRRYNRLVTDEDISNSNDPLSISQQRPLKSKMSDNE